MKQRITGIQAFFLSIVPGLGHFVKGGIASGLLWFIYVSLFYYVSYFLSQELNIIIESRGLHNQGANGFLVVPIFLHFWCAANAVDFTLDPKEQ
jgi:TM2 domain-containing membrane protein YozV